MALLGNPTRQKQLVERAQRGPLASHKRGDLALGALALVETCLRLAAP